MGHHEIEPHPWTVDVALLGAIALIAVGLGLVAHQLNRPKPQPDIARYCENTTGAWLTPDVWADPGFPDYLPCKLLKLEQDV